MQERAPWNSIEKYGENARWGMIKTKRQVTTNEEPCEEHKDTGQKSRNRKSRIWKIGQSRGMIEEIITKVLADYIAGAGSWSTNQDKRSSHTPNQSQQAYEPLDW